MAKKITGLFVALIFALSAFSQGIINPPRPKPNPASPTVNTPATPTPTRPTTPTPTTPTTPSRPTPANNNSNTTTLAPSTSGGGGSSTTNHLQNNTGGSNSGGGSTINSLSNNSPNSSTSALTGTENGYGWVDLGLPSGTKWATCNLGASQPWETGRYYAWGEPRSKSSFTVDNSTNYSRSLGTISGNSNYDAATLARGSRWCLPTSKQLNELRNKCKWTWTTNHNVKGYNVVGPNGKSIFLPVCGSYDGTNLRDGNTEGCYWTGTPASSDLPNNAYNLYFNSSQIEEYWYMRHYGLQIRPVLK